MDVHLVIAGLVVGIIIGLTGVGGGSLLTPVLILLGIPPTSAIGSGLLFSAITKTFGSAQHVIYEHVNWHTVRWLALGSIPSSFLGALTVNHLAETYMGGETLVKQSIGGLIIVIAVMIALRSLLTTPLDEVRTPRPALMALLGALFGFVVGFTSIGSGTLFTLALMVFFHFASRQIVGTVTVHACLLVWSAAAAHALYGNISPGTVSWLLVGSLPGIFAGARLSRSLPEKPLRIALVGVLLVSGIVLLQS